MSTYLTRRAKDLGLKKEDAKSDLEIELKQGDIAKSKVGNSRECAFARACKRAKVADAAYFFRSTAWLEKGGKLTRYMLPPSMQKEIVSFDRARVMAPGVYKISKPCKSQKMGAIQKRSAKRPGRHQPGNTKIKRKIVHRTTLIRTLRDPSLGS